MYSSRQLQIVGAVTGQNYDFEDQTLVFCSNRALH